MDAEPGGYDLSVGYGRTLVFVRALDLAFDARIGRILRGSMREETLRMRCKAKRLARYHNFFGRKGA